MKMDSCFECGGTTRALRERREIRIGQRSATVEDEFLRCDGCNAQFQSADQMDATQRRAVDSIRDQEGLLGSDEIRTLRQKHGLTQAQFERLLGVGPKTVVRWERGTVFQQKSTDALLRVVRELPQAIDVLARLHSVDLNVARLMETHGGTETTGAAQLREGKRLVSTASVAKTVKARSARQRRRSNAALRAAERKKK